MFRGPSSKLFLFAVAVAALVVVPGSSAHDPAAGRENTCSAAPCYVSVTKIGSGTGLVTSEPAGVHCGGTCMVVTDSEASMTLVATPDSGSVVTGWAGCDAFSANRCQLRFDIAKEVTAVFDLVGAQPTPLPAPVGPVPAGAAPADHPPPGSRCTIVGTAAGNILRGTPGRDVICGRGGNDTIYGGAGHDLVVGGGGNDRLFGQAGRDYVAAGSGNDLVSGGGTDDELFGGRGTDTLTARDATTDFVHGGLGRDRGRLDPFDIRSAIEARF